MSSEHVAPILSVEGLTVSLPRNADRKNAVEKVDMVVHPGEILCVVGESGSGKSVTAFTIMGLQDAQALIPTNGKILLGGENLLDKSAAEMRALRGRKMAMIFQEPMTALNPVERVGEQIAEMLAIHTRLSPAERKAKVLQAMEDVYLPDPQRIYESFPHLLSGGQRQRIMIAMALVLEPDLLIADEPTTALDVTTQAQILRLIKELQERKGMGVMFITHDFGVVADIADRVVVMKQGEVVEQGPARDVLRSPRDPYTKMLLAAVPSMTPPERQPVDGAVALTVNGLHKTFGNSGFFGKGTVVRAVKNVDLTLRRGETLGIVGESGSGKSTVVRCVMRLTDPTEGEVWLGETEIGQMPGKALRHLRRDVQMVFQDPYRSLNPRMTIGASLIEGPVNFGVGKAEATERARRLVETVGLKPEALSRYPHQFSGGQRQRICIARALAMQPKVLIADEAVSALDVSVQAQVLDLLNEVRDEFDLAMLFITHDLRVAAQICDRIMVMRKGEVVEEAPSKALFADPGHEYTRALLDAAPGHDFFAHQAQ